MISDIDAVAFDIDGTLYPDSALHRVIVPFMVANAPFMIRFGMVRRQIRLWQEAHPDTAHPDFFTWQASLMASLSGIDVDEAKRLIHDKIYEGWKSLFERVAPFPHVHETVSRFREAGLKIGIMSDFLPSQKGSVWGLADMADVVLGSEETGALKPSRIPFDALARALGVENSRVLYVGNSHASDVTGARAAGMKTACIMSRIAFTLGLRVRGADISFASYRQLASNVLE